MNLQLYQQQLDFVTADEHYLALIGGIGSGKTRAGCVRALLASQGQIGGENVPTPHLGMVTAPTYPMLRDATLRTFFEVAEDLIADFNKSESMVTMTNGSQIIFRSTEHPDRLRGPNILWWMGDEAAMYRGDVWKIMIGRLRQFGMHGWSWLTTTPKGRNWIWQRFEQQRKAGYRKIVAPTWANPFLDEDFIRSLMLEYSGDFARQELEGDFVGFEGLIYPEFSQDVHLHTGTVNTARFKQVIAGVDWGFVNPGVILVGGVDGDGRITIVHEEYQRRRRIEEWAERAKVLRDEWQISEFFCDPSEPDYIEKFTEAGCNAYAADNRVLPGIQAVRQRLVAHNGEPRLKLVPGAANTITEFEQYQWASNKEGLRDQPRKSNDHAQDALRYLCVAVDAGMSTGSAAVETSRWAG